MLSQPTAPPSALFLDRIFRELDGKLTKLQAARDTIAILAAVPAPKFPLRRLRKLLAEPAPDPTPQPDLPAATAAADTPTPAPPPARRGRPRGSRNRAPSVRVRAQSRPEPRALASTIPSGPVVISPAQLAVKREASMPAEPARAQQPAVHAGSLDSLIREVQQRQAFA